MKIFDIRKLLFLSSRFPICGNPRNHDSPHEYLPSLAVSCFKLLLPTIQFPCIVIHQIAVKKIKSGFN